MLVRHIQLKSHITTTLLLLDDTLLLPRRLHSRLLRWRHTLENELACPRVSEPLPINTSLPAAVIIMWRA